MKNLLILILLAVVAYLLYTSGTLSRAVKIAQTAVPVLGTISSDGTMPEISVTVYSPYGTGRTPEPVQITVIAPQPIAPVATARPIAIEPPAFVITPPPPTITGTRRCIRPDSVTSASARSRAAPFTVVDHAGPTSGSRSGSAVPPARHTRSSTFVTSTSNTGG